MLKLIACVDELDGIGRNDSIPWVNNNEMKHFRDTTLNHIVVMGRKTYYSIGRLLNKRINIIFSNNKDFKVDGAEVTNDINYIIDLSKKQDVYIIGGGQIYKLFESYYDELIISKINGCYGCDTFLEIDLNKFQLYKIEKFDDFIVEWYKK